MFSGGVLYSNLEAKGDFQPTGLIPFFKTLFVEAFFFGGVGNVPYLEDHPI